MKFNVTIDRLDSFAKEFWDYVKDAKVFAFHGEMGAGKTTVISVLARFRGTLDITSSPTFSIINEYSFLEQGEEKSFYHIDLYRLNGDQEVMQAGVEDCIYSGEICMVEWPEKSPALFESDAIHVYIETISESERSILVKLPLML